MPGIDGGAWHASLPEPPGTLDGTADADTRDRVEPGALWLTQYFGAAAPGGLAGAQVSGVPVVS